jgi:hypothetical protein
MVGENFGHKFGQVDIFEKYLDVIYYESVIKFMVAEKPRQLPDILEKNIWTVSESMISQTKFILLDTVQITKKKYLDDI